MNLKFCGHIIQPWQCYKWHVCTYTTLVLKTCFLATDMDMIEVAPMKLRRKVRMNGTTDYTTGVAMKTNLSAAAIIRIAAIASSTPV